MSVEMSLVWLTVSKSKKEKRSQSPWSTCGVGDRVCRNLRPFCAARGRRAGGKAMMGGRVSKTCSGCRRRSRTLTAGQRREIGH